ncbi:uncharacterized protein LOC128546738 [Mercenaria mercenaria]|uniref:uncharacterized protein LOC128546738 n=1 Tax=Mercenaria mercenaria TaxID=6596 RepID=UPI00234EF6BF|nr:uncharacterized protein LOC128546738 [Mercenaria mercenaria]
MADEDGDPEFTFSSYEDADHFIEEYEIESGYRHVKQKSKRTQETDITSIGEHKLLLVDKSQKGPTIGSECVFVVVGTELRECMHGMKRQKRKEKEHIDHDYRKSRTRAQDTKKMGCQAKIYIKTILKFPDYKFPEVDTKHNRTLITKRLKQEFSSTTRKVIQVIVKVVGEHSYHDIGEAADFNQPLDKRVVSFIKKKVSDGIRNVDEVMSRVNDLDAVSKSRLTNRRFHPARKMVYNIMYNEINSVKYVKDDQVNTGLYLEEKRKNKDDSVFFRPSSDPETDTEDLSSLLFVYQSKFQKNILQKYRKEVAILDATYNTTKFELPLYMVAVQTNSGFVVVGSFIVGRDTKLQVEEALGMIKSWNPTWSPRYFLMDYILREIGALENTFKGVQVFLCQFHIIQAWKNWLSSNKDLSKDQKETLLETLRAICNSSSEETYSEQVSTLKDTELYRNNKRLRGWLEARWFPEHKRWVDYNREEMTLRNDTTNGLEVQHRLFKENFLKKYGFGGSLQSVVEVLIEKYCPAMEIRYKEKNAKASSTSKLYSDNVPEFLRNRPSDFVKHCLQRMPPKVAVLDQSNVSFDSPERCQLRSPDSDITYSLSFVNMMPVCSCLDFKKKHWPCKHLLGVMLNFPDYSWESLNAVYTGQNCFSLDQSLTNEDIEIETSSQPLHADSEDTEESFLNMQKKCLLLIPEIQNNIYCVNNIEILQETHSKLNSLNTFLMKNIPKLNRLPLRKNRQRKIRKIKRLTGKKTEKFKTHAEKGIKKKAKSTEVSQIDVAKVSQIDAANESNLDQQCRRALQEIWEGPGSDEPVVQIGPFTVTKASLHYLKSTLSDELIDAYLSLLVKGSDILHINCVVATAIFTGNSSMHSFLTNTVLGIHDTCICAVNEGGVHWVLVQFLSWKADRGYRRI